MITFIASLLALILGYIFYGRFIEKTFNPNDKPTPAVKINDGVDYIVLPSWKIFFIQFLNIAGTGPIFGAIIGMWYGPAAYLWIVLGCIFAGAMHDYFSGMLSVRKNGASLPEIVGFYLGERIRRVMMLFSVLLLVMVGAVFVLSPAALIASLLEDTAFGNLMLWIIIIFIYYLIATLLPVDKVIGKIYPLFAFALIFMALGLLIMLFVKMPNLPELWDTVGPHDLGIQNPDPLFPALFITIACGAISGFHATQSPLMARCMKSEHQGKPIFYGAMITEGIVAIIWATISSYFFYSDGWRDVLAATAPDELIKVEQELAAGSTITQVFGNAAEVVMVMCNSWLGVAGGALAVLGVVCAPITSGDTALRSARLIISEFLVIDQRPIRKRLYISIPLFIACIAILIWQMENKDGFSIIWNYFGWANQTLSVFTLWAISVYLSLKKKCYWIALIPAVFMTVVSVSFICVSKQALDLDPWFGYFIAISVGIGFLLIFIRWTKYMDSVFDSKNEFPNERKQQRIEMWRKEREED